MDPLHFLGTPQKKCMANIYIYIYIYPAPGPSNANEGVFAQAGTQTLVRGLGRGLGQVLEDSNICYRHVKWTIKYIFREHVIAPRQDS